MTALTETATWESTITQLETSDLVLGGSDGASNRALKQLANRTSYLLARLNSLTEMPLAALPYPTIDTADHRLTVTPAAATAGGTVSIAAGTRVTLAEVVESSETGRLRAFETAAYTSADLVASSTYYLRAQVDGSGDLAIYVQRGTDSDAIPATKLGTPGASSGGGFDSTAVDMLIAKVVTGSAGTQPLVIALANAHRLELSSALSIAVAQALTWTSLSASDATLNWARTPSIAQPKLTGLAGESRLPDGTLPAFSQEIAMCMVRATSGATTRYTTGGVQYAYADSSGDFGKLLFTWDAAA